MTDRDVEPREEIMRFARRMELFLSNSHLNNEDCEYEDYLEYMESAEAVMADLANGSAHILGDETVIVAVLLMMASDSCEHQDFGEGTRAPSKRLREAVILRDKGVCGICKKEIKKLSEMHIDHIKPWSDNGPTSYDNLQCTHAKCNLEKGATVNVRQDLPQDSN